MEDGLADRPTVLRPVDAERIAGVRVRVETREGAARHEHGQAVSWKEHVARRDEVDRVLVRLAGDRQAFRVEALAEARA